MQKWWGGESVICVNAIHTTTVKSLTAFFGLLPCIIYYLYIISLTVYITVILLALPYATFILLAFIIRVANIFRLHMGW